MFVELNELKGIIVDLESFSRDEDEQWGGIDHCIKILFLCESRRRVFRTDNSNCEFCICDYNADFESTDFVSFYESLGLQPYEVAFVTKDQEKIIKINKKMELPLGTVLITTDSCYDYSSSVMGYVPDYFLESISKINEIISRDIGYFAEVNSLFYPQKSRGYLLGSYKNQGNKKTNIFAAGRYFISTDSRSNIHLLTQRILNNKNVNGLQEELFQRIFQRTVEYVKSRDRIDALSRVPPKPNEYDRFGKIVNNISTALRIEDLCSNLKTVKTYVAQKSFKNPSERRDNVDGVFEVDCDLTGKNIVLLDDVITSGATAFECAKRLYDSGANNVTVVVMGINQITNCWRKTFNIGCICGGVMKLKVAKNTKKWFWGCSNYSSNSCKRTISLLEGIQFLNRQKTNDKFVIIDDETNFSF